MEREQTRTNFHTLEKIIETSLEADSFLSKEELELLNRVDELDSIKLDILSYFYPEGIPEDVREQVNMESCIEVEGSIEVMIKWLDICDLLEVEKTKHLKQ